MQTEKKKNASNLLPTPLSLQLPAFTLAGYEHPLSCSNAELPTTLPTPPTSVEPNQQPKQSHHSSSCALPFPNTPLKPTDHSRAPFPKATCWVLANTRPTACLPPAPCALSAGFLRCKAWQHRCRQGSPGHRQQWVPGMGAWGSHEVG